MKHKLFSIFLVIYFIAIFFHSKTEDGFTSLFFYLGISLAIFAHAKKNWVTVLMLFLHMAIEWYAWGQNFNSGIESNFLIIIHVIMDFIFLHHEIKVHIKKHLNKIIGIILILLFIIFFFAFTNNEGNFHNNLHEHHHNHGSNLFLHLFTLGGVLGCVGSHLSYHIFKEKPDKN